MAEKMKPSGIDWIGDIPESWDVVRIKDIGTYRNGLTYAPEDIAEDDNGTLVLRSSNIQNGKISYDDNVYVKCSVSPELMVKKGDIIICSRNGSRELIGKNAIIENSGLPCSFGAFMMVYRCSCPRYMYYILNSEVFSYYLGTFLTSTINQLTGNNFGNMKIVFCKNRNEQKKIVDFLDKECAQIDSIAADLEKQIALLQQYKKSLITETLTKGLDKSAPMKDSEVEWIGKIPEHWELKHLKYLAKSILDGAHLTPTYTDDGIPFLRVTDITSVDGIDAEINLDTVARISKEEHRILCQRCHPQKGDVLVSKNGTIGVPKIIDWDWEFSIFVSLCLIKLNDSLLNKWLFYYFKSTLVATEIAFAGKTNTITNLHLEKIANFKIPLPSVEEQKLIATYLDEKVCKIDALIKEKQSQLETLRQHKKSLIYEYVTGKKRVKEVQ